MKRNLTARPLTTKTELKSLLVWLEKNSPYNAKQLDQRWLDDEGWFDKLCDQITTSDGETLMRPINYTGNFVDDDEATLFKLTWG